MKNDGAFLTDFYTAINRYYKRTGVINGNDEQTFQLQSILFNVQEFDVDTIETARYVLDGPLFATPFHFLFSKILNKASTGWY